MKFFADHCISKAIIKVLQDDGHEVLRVKDFIPQDSPDQRVIAKAQELGAVLLTLDQDFVDIVTYPPEQFQGIVALQVRDHPEAIPSLMKTLKEYLSTHQNPNDYKGKLILVEIHRIRFRH